MLGVVMGLGACGQTVAPPPPGSRNYYVDGAAGNDAAAGDSAHPFKTIQHAANLVNPGDVVVVRNGLYTGSGSILDIERGGTTGNYVVFRAAVQWGAVLDGGQTSHSQPNGAENGVYLGASFVRVEGFEIRNVWHDGISPSSSASDFQVDENHVHDIGRDSLGQNGCNPGNDYWQNHDHGIYLSSGTNAVIRNNVFYNITRGWAIQCFPGPLSQTYIANNTFAFPNPHRDGQIIVAATLTTGAIVNNVFYQPQTAGVLFEGATPSNVVVQYNLTMGGTATTGS